MPSSFPEKDLTLQYESQSYQGLVQEYSPGGGDPNEYFLDGVGNVILSFPITSIGQSIFTTNQTASEADHSILSDTASIAGFSEFSDTASYALVSYFSDTASYVNQSLSASYVPNVLSASYASQSSFSPVVFSNVQIINGELLILSTDTNQWYALGVTDNGSGSYTTNLTPTVNTGSSYVSGTFYSVNSFNLYTTSSGYATSSLSASWASQSLSASYAAIGPFIPVVFDKRIYVDFDGNKVVTGLYL